MTHFLSVGRIELQQETHRAFGLDGFLGCRHRRFAPHGNGRKHAGKQHRVTQWNDDACVVGQSTGIAHGASLSLLRVKTRKPSTNWEASGSSACKGSAMRQRKRPKIGRAAGRERVGEYE